MKTGTLNHHEKFDQTVKDTRPTSISFLFKMTALHTQISKKQKFFFLQKQLFLISKIKKKTKNYNDLSKQQ